MPKMFGMKGLLVDETGGPYLLVESIKKPKPGKNEILVTSVVTGVSPIVNIMQQSGSLVEGWPMVLGCDASGIVYALGEGVTRFQIGDRVFGCTRMGVWGYGTFQDRFLMDERLTFHTPSSISYEAAATIGLGLLASTLGLVNGLRLQLPEPGVEATKVDEWLLVLGGSGCVGQYAIQLGKLCGYKVLASTSRGNLGLVERMGADASFCHDVSPQTLLNEIAMRTDFRCNLAFDATGCCPETAFAVLGHAPMPETPGSRRFATVDDWSPMAPHHAYISTYRVHLGVIGRSREGEVGEINSEIESYVPKLETFLARGDIRPIDYVSVGLGFGAITDGIRAMDGVNDGRKVVVPLVVRR